MKTLKLLESRLKKYFMVLIVDKNLVLRQFAQRHLANQQFTNNSW